jgi:hypothetical protein
MFQHDTLTPKNLTSASAAQPPASSSARAQSSPPPIKTIPSNESTEDRNLLSKLISGELEVTEENVGKIIDELHQDQNSWQKLYNLLEGSERNAEKGLLCDELYRKFAKQDPKIANLCEVEKTVAATWSQHMEPESLLEMLKVARPKFIIATLVNRGFIQNHSGNVNILTNSTRKIGSNSRGSILSE